MTPRLLLISPVRNEAAHIARLVHSVASQRVKPAAWLVVDDGSSDGTAEIARRSGAGLDFLRVIAAPDSSRTDAVDDRLADAAELRALNHALGLVAREHFTHVGKLDGDIELPPGYFERALGEFEADPRLGVVGGDLVEPTRSGWRLVRIPRYHVHGALKLYSRECLEAIGGLQERLGWDTIDETYARMAGFETRTLPDLTARHHRPCGSSGSRLRGMARYGHCAYVNRYGLGWVALRSLKVARSRPYGLSGAAFLSGYMRAASRRAARVEDPDFERFVRSELRRRLLPAFGANGR